MIPVLLSVAGISITSFGLFLTIATLLALFASWRLARVYEIDLEKFLDIFFLTLVGAIIFARLYFVLFHWSLFTDPFRVLLVNKYPGFSFWGGLLGGIVSVRLFAHNFKINFWQLMDFGTVALFLGVAIADIGCLLNSCRYGVPSDLPFAVVQAGILGTRFPIQVIESILFLLVFFNLWKSVLRFHLDGTIFAKGLLWLGILGLLVELGRGDPEFLPYFPVNVRFIWNLFAFGLGVYLFYRQNRRSLFRDVRLFLGIFSSSRVRNYVISKLSRSWYNQVVNLRVRMQGFRRKFIKSLNMRSNPERF